MKNTISAIVAVLVLVVLGFLISRYGSGPQGEPAAPTASTSTSTVSTTTATNSKTAVPSTGTTGGGHAGYTYGGAINTFQNRRMQFDQNCVATPNYFALKNGTSFMFDNRSPQGRYFSLDGTRYYLAGYDFRIVTLRAAKLPHTMIVDCGNGRNTAQIILQ